MEVKVAANSLHWTQPSVPHSPSFAKSSPSPKRRSRLVAGDGSPFTPPLILSVRRRSCNNRTPSVITIRNSLASISNSFPDEEFSKSIQEFASRFQPIDDVAAVGSSRTEDSDFPERDETIPANIERKANSLDIPVSLRIIKSKKRWQEGFAEAGESACCSVKRAFSSMVFIIRELHSYTLQLREALFYEDLQGIIARVQKDTHASFVWLFQKVFSHTPTLMVYVMILLANYSVHSLSDNVAMVAALAPGQVEEVCVVEDHMKFDSSKIRTLNLSSLNGKTASVDGNGGNGGGKSRRVANGTDGDGRFDESSTGLSSSQMGEESVLKRESHEEEESLDQNMQISVFPDDASVVEGSEGSDHLRMEMQYEMQLACDPKNSLLLANYAQFLYLVAKDYNRAEEFFKKATQVEPRDAEALNKYATFMWRVRDDLWAAEETYLEAISMEPSNSYYAACYAHFLWNTGGEDTCFPLGSPEDDIQDL